MGLYYLALMLIWFGVLWWVVKGLAWRVDHRYKSLISLIVIVVVYPLPLVDEIVGAIQFSILCEHQVIYKAPDMEKRRGSRLIFVSHEKKRIDGKALHMTSEIWEYVSERDKAVLFSYAVINAYPGILARKFTLNEGGSPLIFTGVCYPEEREAIFSKYNFVN